jgi:hypothetical protein
MLSKVRYSVPPFGIEIRRTLQRVTIFSPGGAERVQW